MAKPRKADHEEVIDGRLVRLWRRRDEYEVNVYASADGVGEPVGEWGMPKQLGVPHAMQAAASQTPKGGQE